MKKTTIYIVDDHEIVAQGLELYLAGNEEFEIVGSANSANELLQFLMNNKQPDILILDIKMPGLSGIHVAKIITNKYSSTKIIFLSSNTDKESLNNAIAAGGVGYLSKDIKEEEFLQALKKIINGENYYSSGIQQAVFNNFTTNIKSNNNKNLTPLTSREIDIVKLFAEGLLYKEIAERLSISPRTVETHKKNILEKLKLKTTVDLVKYAIRNGIISL